MGYGFKIKKTGTGVTNADGSPLIGPMIQDEGHSIHYRSPFQYTDITNWHQLTVIDNDCETTNTITYTLVGKGYGIGGSRHNVGGNQWDNIQWSIFFQEIKR